MEVRGQDSRPSRFTPGERAPGTRWIGDSGGCGLEKISLSLPGIEPWPSSP
jgi:hypothetical protein